MTKTVSATLALVAAVAVSARGQNTIVQWNGAVPPTAFEIDQVERSVRIIQGGGFEFKFYALDPTAPLQNGLGIINNITIDAGATGDFTLLIDQPTAGQRGAFRWSAGDLRYPGGTCTIVGIDVTELLARDDPPGPPPPVEHIFCGNISGPINIGTLGPVSAGAPTNRRIEAGAVVGDIYIENFRGELDFASLAGNITTGTGPNERTPGDLLIRSKYVGTICSFTT